MMTWIRYDYNGYGTQISVHVCESCESEFTVCPAIKPDKEGWDGCMAPICLSYDPGRDADKLFDEGKVRFRMINSGRASILH